MIDYSQSNKMDKFIIGWINKYWNRLCVLVLFVLSVYLRLSLADGISGDAETYLLQWYTELKNSGGFWGLDHQVGNYNMLYQFIIAMLTYLPMEPIYAIKLSSCFFDYILAVGVFALVYELTDRKKNYACIAYFITVFSPLVWINSAWWAQCDAMYVSMCVWALYFYCKDKYLLCFIFYGISFAFKFQSIFLLPLFLFLYVYHKRFSIFNFVIIPLMMMISALPCLIAGRGKKSLIRVLTFYFGETDTWKRMYLNYPSFWCLLRGENSESYFELMKRPAMILTVIILAGFMMYWFNNKVRITDKSIIYMAFLISYTCVLFLPAMHERYGFMPEILGIIVVFMNKKTIIPLILLNIIVLALYGNYLIAGVSATNLYVLAMLNIGIYLAFVYILNKEILLQSKTV